MWLKYRELMEKADAIFVRFAHADDPATANRDAGFTNIFERAKPVLVVTCRDDPAIKVGGRVEIVVVCMESGLSQTPGLRFIQHAKGAAHFQTKRRNTPDHFQNRVEFRTVVHLPPGRSHAKSVD